MRKDLSKRKSASDSRRRLWLVLLLVSIIGSLVFFIQKNKENINSEAMMAYVTKIKNWAALRKDRLQKELHKVSKKRESDTENTPVHFEFYSALPAMRMSSSESPMKTQSVTNVFASHEQLEREFASELKVAPSYFIQLGIFKDLAAAERYRQSLIKEKITARIKKVTLSNKSVYRVQVGPFTNKAQMQVAAQQLQSKGLPVLVRKITSE